VGQLPTVHSANEADRGSSLDWISDEEFEIDGVGYACRPIHDMFESTPERFCLRKPARLVRRLELLLRDGRPTNIVEVGVFEGGSTGFIAQALRPGKLICFDIEPRHSALERMLDEHGLGETVSPHWEIDQSDGARLREIVRAELGEAPIDLVIDDASHFLDPTRATFEALFPLVAPGGIYLIEDWAWAHGITNAWPSRAPLSVLVLELVLANAHRPEAVERVDVDRDWTLVKRGPRELDDGFDLIEHCGERGRALLPPPGAGVQAPDGPHPSRLAGARSLATRVLRRQGDTGVG
jgi:predicted O-methyltransferase YrrM